MKVLVTGAGSLIGHGILRCLGMIKDRQIEIFTADPDHRAAGHWLGQHALLIPMAKDANYIDQLSEVIAKNKIDVVFIGTDPELMKISENRSQLKCTAIVSTPNVIRVGDDKWETVNFLKSRAFPFPDTALANDNRAVEDLVARVGFPLIAKPRIGARSVGVRTIRGAGELSGLPADTIVQEYLPDGPGEFTAGTMTYNGICSSQVIFRRDLKEGNTYRAYAHNDEGHERFLKKVSESLDGVYGPLNFQYRLRNGEPVIFEINTRFSGTTPLRTVIGVNEVEMSLDFVSTGRPSTPTKLRRDVAILRTWADVVVPMEQIEELKTTQRLDFPKADYFPFMKP